MERKYWKNLLTNQKICLFKYNNQVIGTPEGMLYNDVTECIDISPSIEQCRQLICIDDEYQGSTVTITALDAETNATLSTLKLNFEND